MKKLLSILMVLVLSLSLVACGGEEGEGGTPQGGGENEKVWKACFITSTPRGNEFTDLIWSGLEDLGAEGWEIKCIETFSTGEITEQVRAMVADGYDVIYTQGDDVIAECMNLMSESREINPDVWFVYLDTYTATTDEKTCAVTIDPFEACFIAGYVAARRSATGEIGMMLPQDTPIMDRFEYGYRAGVDYANSLHGTSAVLHKGKTNTWNDTTLGYEATNSLLGTYPNIDLMIQCAYISGYGVIQACADKKIPCIGVDDWQGDIDPIVFWSAIKSMDIAVYLSANSIKNGEGLPNAREYNLADGGAAYAEVDLPNLGDELAAEVVQLEADIISGKVDIFAGEYEVWRVTDFDQE